eukprot:3894356-Pyramimonas_sp.AAC.1
MSHCAALAKLTKTVYPLLRLDIPAKPGASQAPLAPAPSIDPMFQQLPCGVRARVQVAERGTRDEQPPG